jgi:hypothetical protein
MSEQESLRGVIEDLIDVMHLQAKELEKLVVQVERSVGRLPGESQLAVIASELAELKQRVKRAGP